MRVSVRLLATLSFLLLLAALPVAAQEPSPAANGTGTRPVPTTPDEKVSAILGEYDAATKAFQKAYEEAKTPAEKEKLEYPQASKYFPKVLALAHEYPKDAAAVRALKWIVGQDADSVEGREALKIFAREHIADPVIKDVADELHYSVTTEAEGLLRDAMRNGADDEVRARAAYALAHVLRRSGDVSRRLNDPIDPEDHENLEKWVGAENCARLKAKDAAKLMGETEEILVMLQDKHAKVPANYGGSLGERAERDLFELRNLSPGKVAPEIEGEDIDGKPMKLSDFKGKVVVLDFWGHW